MLGFRLSILSPIKDNQNKDPDGQKKDTFTFAIQTVAEKLAVPAVIQFTVENPPPKKPQLKIVVAACFLMLFVYLAYNLYQGQVEQGQSDFTNSSKAEARILGTKTLEERQERFPVHVIIPTINVDANIQQVGVTPDGDVEVPSNTIETGWFKFGSLPGENGSAIVVGHLNGEGNERGVFSNLSKLKTGDKIYIEDDGGSLTTFVVQKTRTYDPGYADDVFNQSDGVHLNLITCDGAWDEVKKSYSKRLVVFSDIEL